MPDINRPGNPGDSDQLGLDNENILSRHKQGASAPGAGDGAKSGGRSSMQPDAPRRVNANGVVQPRQSQGDPAAKRPAARPVSRQVGQEQPTRQIPRAPKAAPDHVSEPISKAPGAPGAGARRQPRPVSNDPSAPVRRQNAVVPGEKRDAVVKEESKAPAAPAYAARRSIASASAPSFENSGTKQSAPSGSIEKPDKKKGSTKAGADMMVSIVKGIIYMVLVLVVSVFISIFAIRVGNDVFAFVKSDEQIDVTIPEDATTSDIADILYDSGIIKYPSIFKLYASLKHEKGDYLAGSYTVSPSLSYDKLRGSFKKQVETGTCWITIPEGYTTDEIIDLMVENGIGERDAYIDVINNYDFDYWFIDELESNGIPEERAYRLDGYLFPDSYQFYKASSEATVINRLLARFEEVFVEDYKTRASQLGYSVDQILTIASMVEKEASSSADFMNVSSVFHNRLNDPYNFARLQSDATTVYAIQVATGQRPKDIKPEDNNFESPYNTYLNNGLPPGPITNPSASAIRYALYPANTNYKFFISANNGVTYFAATEGEHNANIEKVRQINAE